MNVNDRVSIFARRALVAASVVVIATAATASAAEHDVTFESLLREMVDRDRLARLPSPTYKTGQASSYERLSVRPDRPGWFANHDWSHFVRAEKHDGRTEWVMLDTDGPGAVVRIWMGAPRPDKGPIGTLRFYLDGSDTPAITARADDLLAGRSFVEPPLSAVRSIGRNLYLPIPYARGCKVTYDVPNYWQSRDGMHRTWYVIEHRSYASGTRVESFSDDVLERSRGALLRVGALLLEPAAANVTADAKPKTARLERGQTLAEDVAGSGAVRRITVRLEADDMERALRATIVKVAFDGDETVWCPAGDFFGSGVGLNPYRGWWRPLARAGGGAGDWVKPVARDGAMTCYWVMPFATSCKVELENLDGAAVNASLAVVVDPSWSWDDRSMYFHARWRQQQPFWSKKADGFDWNYVEIRGEGVYVGDTLAMRNGVPAWWGEGDEKIFVDGETFPTHFGTGTEDYYGYSFGDRGVFFEAPFHSQPRPDGNNQPGWVTVTRSRSLDAIPFRSSLRFDMEVWHWARSALAYAATTYWYARPGAISNRPPDPYEAIQPIPGTPRRVPGAIEGETMRVVRKSAGIVEVQTDSRWSDDKHLWWRDAKPGDRLALLLPVERAGRYRIAMNGTRAFDYGIFRFWLDGKELAGPIDLYSRENTVRKVALGTRDLEAGGHSLEIEITGTNPDAKPRHMIGIDYFALETVK